MPRLPLDSIGNGYVSDHCWNVLEDLVAIGNRMAGHEGEKQGAAVVRDAFADAGLREISTTEFEIPGWWRGSSSIVIGSPHKEYASDHEVIALPGGPSGEVKAELVDLGHGLPEDIGDDVAGKIAMVRSDSPPGEDYVHRMVKYAAAVEAGAVGFVYRNHVEGCLPPTGNVRLEERTDMIPAVGVSKEAGAQLARYCKRSDGAIEATLSVDCRHETATSVNTRGVIGPETEEAVLVTAHIDAHDIGTGAADNGVGTALVTEIARLLAQSEERLDTRVECLIFGAEEIGLLGAQHAAEQMELDHVKCVLNIDAAGESRDIRLRSHGFESVTDAFETVVDELGASLTVDDEILPHTDAWRFCEEGVPSVTAGSATKEEGRGWGHTHADTLDKLDRRDLRDLALVFANVAVELADDDREFPWKSRAEIRDALSDHVIQELTASGRWSFETDGP